MRLDEALRMAERNGVGYVEAPGTGLTATDRAAWSRISILRTDWEVQAREVWVVFAGDYPAKLFNAVGEPPVGARLFREVLK